MRKIKKIMVAVDFSKYSLKIVDYAKRLAEGLNGQLVFVNVINQRDVNMVKQVAAHTDKISVKAYTDGLKEDRSEEMKKILEEKGCTQIPHRLIFKIGIPYVDLIDTAKEEQVDIVVMGAKGRSDLADFFFGSTAEKMFRRCPVPVLSIRETDN